MAPDGSVTIGAYDGGFTGGGEFDARGSGVVFHPDGAVASQVDFNWDITPSVRRLSGGEYTWLQVRNLYSDGDLSVAEYTPDIQLETTSRVTPDPASLNIDWVSSQVLVDTDGSRYSANGDGHFYKFGPNGELADAVVLPNPDGSPRDMSLVMEHTARDRHGHFYVSHVGYVYVIEAREDQSPNVPTRAPTSRRRMLGRIAQHAAAEAAATFVDPPDR